MQSRHFKRINFLAAAALLIVSGVEDRASCQAEESWEEHVVITPIPLVADGRIPIARPKSKKLTSITETPVPFDSSLSEPVFPLRWPERMSGRSLRNDPWKYDPWSRGMKVPCFLQRVFTRSDTLTVDLWNAWSACDREQFEWGPLRLAGMTTEDQAVPAQIVPHVTINHLGNWFRFRCVYPTLLKRESLTEYRDAKFQLTQLNFDDNTTWSRGLRVYKLRIEPVRDDINFREDVRTSTFDSKEVVEVDATKMSYDIGPIGDVQPNDTPQSDFDKWLGETRADVAPNYDCCHTDFTR